MRVYLRAVRPRPGSHRGIRRRLSVQAARADKLFTRLRTARLDNTLETEMCILVRGDLLILDDFALRWLNPPVSVDLGEQPKWTI